MNKKKRVNELIKFSVIAVKKLFGTYKPKILFIAPVSHHTVHLEPVIEQILKTNALSISVLGPFTARKNVRVYDDTVNIKIYEIFDIVITTEFGTIPWWLDAKRIFFGHGVGPKLNYQTNSQLSNFDYSFCPCEPIFLSQKNIDVLAFKIGLPILDKLVFHKKSHKIVSQKKLIVYAPNWCNKIEMVSDINLILKCLETLTNMYNVIVSPHPNLLNPHQCDGKSFFADTSLDINLPGSGKSTIDLCTKADIVISDISSVMFESLAIGTDVYFDGNFKVYQYCEAIFVYEEMIANIPTLIWDKDLVEQMSAEYPSNSNYINKYVYNIGNATNIFIDKVIEALH